MTNWCIKDVSLIDECLFSFALISPGQSFAVKLTPFAIFRLQLYMIKILKNLTTEEAQSTVYHQ